MTILSGEKFFTIGDLAARGLGSARTWRRRIARREIAFVRLDGGILIPEDSLEQYLESRFVPAVARQPLAAASIETILDRVAPRKRQAVG